MWHNIASCCFFYLIIFSSSLRLAWPVLARRGGVHSCVQTTRPESSERTFTVNGIFRCVGRSRHIHYKRWCTRGGGSRVVGHHLLTGSRRCPCGITVGMVHHCAQAKHCQMQPSPVCHLKCQVWAPATNNLYKDKDYILPTNHVKFVSSLPIYKTIHW